MKKFYFTMAAIFLGLVAYSQCSVSIGGVVNPACNGLCTGSATATPQGFVPNNPTFSWAPGGQTTQTATNLCAGTYTCTATNGICTASATVTITEPTVLIATETNTDVACFGGANGSATATANGGTPNYSYSWNTAPVQNTQTAVGLSPGSYTCTVTDNNGCTTTVVAVITEPSSAVSAVATNTNVSCFGGSDATATANATGGTPGYTYSWNSTPVQTTATATGLPIGTYACTVTDANGCSTSSGVTITQPATAVVATATSTSTSCNGDSDGTATVAATGGTPGYTYLWSVTGDTTTTSSGLTAGTYTATVTDTNGCVTTASVTVTQPGVLMANVTVLNDSCNGSCDGVGMAAPTGGTSPFAYSWTSGNTAQNDSDLCAGSHGVVVTDANGCTTNQIFTVTQPTVLVVTATATDATCVGCMNGSGTATATGGTGPYSYLWMPGSQTTQTASGLGLGTYTVCVTDANGCAQVCDTITVNDGTAIQNLAAIYNLNVFPNPANDFVNITMNSSTPVNVVVSLYDITGREVIAKNFGSTTLLNKSIDISTQPAGIYILEVLVDGQKISAKVSKQ